MYGRFLNTPPPPPPATTSFPSASIMCWLSKSESEVYYSSVLNYVSRVVLCILFSRALTCLRALCPHVTSCLCLLRAFPFFRASSFFTCITCLALFTYLTRLYFSTYLHFFKSPKCPYPFTCFTCFHFFYVPYVL